MLSFQKYIDNQNIMLKKLMPTKIYGRLTFYFPYKKTKQKRPATDGNLDNPTAAPI
jgi:hypothetical protein